MPQRNAGAASLSKVRRHPAPSQQDIGVSHSRTETRESLVFRPVAGLATRRYVTSALRWTATTLVAFAILAASTKPSLSFLAIIGACVIWLAAEVAE